MSNSVLLLILFNFIIMAKKTVFSNPTARETHSRNPFDRSYTNNINFSSGMAVPTMSKFVFGHSHCRFNQSSFFRTSDVNKAAFPGLPLYTDYFFVPMTQILSTWNDFRSRTNDRFSTRLGNISRLPSFDKSALVTALASISGTTGGDLQISDAIRLLDWLDYGWNHQQLGQYTNFNITVLGNLNAIGAVTPLFLCAYQKIYYDFYRNTAYEPNDVSAYNLDDLYTLSGDNETVGTISSSRLLKFLNLHYVNYKRDFLNTIYPSLNFISSAANGLQSNNFLPASVINNVVASNGSSLAMGFPLFDGSSVNVSGFAGNNNANVISIQNVRVAFALEKLLRVSAFTPQHVKDQFAARFGYTPKSSYGRECTRLGSFKNDIVIGEVTSTASSSTVRLGQVGGKGVGAANFERTIEFDTPEDGIVMAISYVLPSNTYDSGRVDMIHQQFVPEDWSLPEYENLGLQPIYIKNLFNDRTGSSDTDAAQLARGNTIFGFQPRDMQYKASVSVNHGEFVKGMSMEAWVLHGRWSVLQALARSPQAADASYFKCTPSDVDELFVDAYDGTPFSDQFFGHIVNSFGCVQDKPILGIPKL